MDPCKARKIFQTWNAIQWTPLHPTNTLSESNMLQTSEKAWTSQKNMTVQVRNEPVECRISTTPRLKNMHITKGLLKAAGIVLEHFEAKRKTRRPYAKAAFQQADDKLNKVPLDPIKAPKYSRGQAIFCRKRNFIGDGEQFACVNCSQTLDCGNAPSDFTCSVLFSGATGGFQAQPPARSEYRSAMISWWFSHVC